MPNLLHIDIDSVFKDQLAEEVANKVVKKLSVKFVVALRWPPMLDYKDIMRFFGCQTAKAFDIMHILPCKEGVGSRKISIWGLLDWIDENPDLVSINFPDYSGYGSRKETAI